MSAASGHQREGGRAGGELLHAGPSSAPRHNVRTLRAIMPYAVATCRALASPTPWTRRRCAGECSAPGGSPTVRRLAASPHPPGRAGRGLAQPGSRRARRRRVGRRRRTAPTRRSSPTPRSTSSTSRRRTTCTCRTRCSPSRPGKHVLVEKPVGLDAGRRGDRGRGPRRRGLLHGGHVDPLPPQLRRRAAAARGGLARGAAAGRSPTWGSGSTPTTGSCGPTSPAARCSTSAPTRSPSRPGCSAPRSGGRRRHPGTERHQRPAVRSRSPRRPGPPPPSSAPCSPTPP